jgi:hypothetical protein
LVAVVLGSLAALACALVAAVLLAGPRRPSQEPPDYFDPDATGIPTYAINTPRAIAADKVQLRDDEEVFGVTAGGKHRAYRVRALGGNPYVHVVNDVVDGVPVSLAHCDRTGCTKAFTGDEAGRTLKVAFGGWRRGQMWIRADRGIYEHATLEPAVSGFPPFPYRETPFQRTTWKEWKEAHPDTDVYVGIEKGDRPPG